MLYTPGRARVVDANGKAVNNAKVTFYLSGTTTLAPLWSNADLSTDAPNPARSNAAGFLPPTYLDPAIAYKVVTTTALDVLLPDGVVDPLNGSVSEIDISPTEDSLGVVPVAKKYAVYDPRRYGAIGDNAFNSTAAFQTAMRVAQVDKATVPVAIGIFLCDPGLLLTFTGTRFDSGLNMRGEGMGSVIRVRGSPTNFTFIELRGQTPTAVPNEGLVQISNLVIEKTGAKSGVGLMVNNIADVELNHVVIRGFSKDFYNLSALVVVGRSCHFTDADWGVYSRQNGFPGTTGVTAGSTTNLIEFDSGCRYNYCSQWGVDYDHGSALRIDGDVEACGTPANASTGGILIGANLAPDAQLGNVEINAWCEANFGTQIRCEAQVTPNVVSTLKATPRQLVASESGRALIIAGASQVLLQNISCGPGEILNVTARNLTAINVRAATLTFAPMFPTIINCASATAEYPFGLATSYTARGVGFSGTAPTASMFLTRQGNRTWLRMNSLSGTSNSTSFSIENGDLAPGNGMPALYAPSGSRNVLCHVQNNGAYTASYAVVETSGLITVYKDLAAVAAGFTNSGTKALAFFNNEYEN